MKVTTLKEYLNESMMEWSPVRDYEYELKFKSFKLSDEDLYEIAKYGLVNELGMDSGCWDDNEDDLESAAECIVGDFKEMLETPFREGWGLKFSFRNKFTIFRLVNLENGEESLDKSNLGLYWFTDPEAPEGDSDWFAQLEYLGRSKSYVIEADVDIRQVDIIGTLFKRSTNSAENELTLRDGENAEFRRLVKYEDWVDNWTITK